MARLIDVEPLIDECDECINIEWNHKVAPVSWADAEEEFKQRLLDAPTIEAEPVKQEWKPIKGFEGLYEVNRYGQIRNANGKLMRQQLKHAKHTSYKKVNLYKNGKYAYLYVHRIVAEAFIENLDGYELINHIDEDGTNNFVENLEWCNRSQNALHGKSPKRISKANKGRESEKRKAVAKIENGVVVKTYSSITEAAKDVGGSTYNISSVCKGRRKTAYGYEWSYCYNCGADMRGE